MATSRNQSWRKTAKSLSAKKRPRVLKLWGGRELYLPAMTVAEAKAEAARYKRYQKRDKHMAKAEKKIRSWGEPSMGKIFGTGNPGPSAIPSKWTPAVVSRKGGQIQIRMGGR